MVAPRKKLIASTRYNTHTCMQRIDTGDSDVLRTLEFHVIEPGLVRIRGRTEFAAESTEQLLVMLSHLPVCASWLSIVKSLSMAEAPSHVLNKWEPLFAIHCMIRSPAPILLADVRLDNAWYLDQSCRDGIRLQVAPGIQRHHVWIEGGHHDVDAG